MRRLSLVTFALWTLLIALVATLSAYWIRRAGDAEAVIAHQVNDLVATCAIPLDANPQTIDAIPGWVTLSLVAAAATTLLLRLQRARSKRS